MKKIFAILMMVMVLFGGVASADDGVKIGFTYKIDAYTPDGTLKWSETIHNIVPTAGLNHMADVTLHGSTQATTWYIGLLADSPTPAAGDTMSSHAGWTEFTAYDESTRGEWTEGAASSGSITNSTTVDFTISTNSSIVAGAFLCSDSTKSGTSGTLISVAAFSGGDQSLDDGDTLKVTGTFTVADDGA